MAGSQAFNTVNGGGKKKRSTEPDADPGFHHVLKHMIVIPRLKRLGDF